MPDVLEVPTDHPPTQDDPDVPRFSIRLCLVTPIESRDRATEIYLNGPLGDADIVQIGEGLANGLAELLPRPARLRILAAAAVALSERHPPATDDAEALVNCAERILRSPINPWESYP